MNSKRKALLVLAVTAWAGSMESLGAESAAAHVPEATAAPSAVADAGVAEAVATGPPASTNKVVVAQQWELPCVRRYDGGWKVKICRPQGEPAAVSATPTPPVASPAAATPAPVAPSAPAPVATPPVPVTPVAEASAPPAPNYSAEFVALEKEVRDLQLQVGLIAEMTKEISPPVPRPLEAVDRERASWFRWGFGLNGVAMASPDPGPTTYTVEGQFDAELQFVENWFFAINIGPGIGYSSYDEEKPFSLSEFGGITYNGVEDFAFTIGGRHRAVFLREGDLLNAIAGEAQVGIRLYGQLTLVVAGGIGAAWYIFDEVPNIWVPNRTFPAETKPGDGMVYTGSLGLFIRL